MVFEEIISSFITSFSVAWPSIKETLVDIGKSSSDSSISGSSKNSEMKEGSYPKQLVSSSSPLYRNANLRSISSY